MQRTFNLIRLGALPLSLTLITILAGSVINRVLVVELGRSNTMAALFLSIPLWVAPLRVWLGYLSDGYPLRGLRREPYLILGAIISAVGAALSVMLALRAESLLSVAGGVLVITLLGYGIGRNLANNTFQALIADLFAPGPPRSRAANLYEVVKIVGMIMGAGLVSQALRPYSPERLVAVVGTIAGLVVIFSVIATVRQEPRTPAMQEASRIARATPFWPTFRALLWNDPTARLFFLIVTLTLFGTQMQDVLLEPYGGLVFGLSVSATTALTMFWGLGTLISILLSGLFFVKWLGLKPLFRVGIAILLVLFPLLVVAGYLQNATLLRLTVLGLGLGTGLAAASLLALMVQFTTVRRAGLMVGVWGVGHQLGRALASLTGGVLVDGMNRITQNNYLVSYGSAFVLEALMLLVALVLIGRLQIESAEALREEHATLSPAPAT